MRPPVTAGLVGGSGESGFDKDLDPGQSASKDIRSSPSPRQAFEGAGVKEFQLGDLWGTGCPTGPRDCLKVTGESG